MTRNKRPAPTRKPAKPAKKIARVRAVARPRPVEIPERGLKIGEAADRIGVETYVLRFWETQFPFLKPKHSRTRHRFYHPRDLEVLGLIKRLLHQQGFTIAGANKHIRAHGIDALMIEKGAKPPARSIGHGAEARANGSADSKPADAPTRRVLSEVRRDLENLHRLLRG
ncbi:MAG: MerR family transcriptional regulator [Candidatus Binataceae bacterium]